MYEYIVSYGPVNVRVVCEDKETVIHDAVKKILEHGYDIPGVGELRILAFHEDIKDYYCVDGLDSLPNIGKLKLEVLPKTLKDEINTSEEFEDVATESDSPCPALGSNGMWPVVFKIPKHKFSTALLMECQHGTLSSKLKAELLSALYDDITQITYYPTHHQLHSVMQALLMEFPRLGAGFEQHDQALRYWRQQLSVKMRNIRRRRDQGIPVIQARKQDRRTHRMGNFSDSNFVPAWAIDSSLTTQESLRNKDQSVEDTTASELQEVSVSDVGKTFPSQSENLSENDQHVTERITLNSNLFSKNSPRSKNQEDTNLYGDHFLNYNSGAFVLNEELNAKTLTKKARLDKLHNTDEQNDFVLWMKSETNGMLEEDALTGMSKHSIDSVMDDEFSAFGTTVAHELRGMTRVQAIIAKKLINEALFLGNMSYLTPEYKCAKLRGVNP